MTARTDQQNELDDNTKTVLCRSLKTRSGADVTEGGDSATLQSLEGTRGSTDSKGRLGGRRNQQQEEYPVVNKQEANNATIKCLMNTLEHHSKGATKGDCIACATSAESKEGEHCVACATLRVEQRRIECMVGEGEARVCPATIGHRAFGMGYCIFFLCTHCEAGPR